MTFGVGYSKSFSCTLTTHSHHLLCRLVARNKHRWFEISVGSCNLDLWPICLTRWCQLHMCRKYFLYILNFLRTLVLDLRSRTRQTQYGQRQGGPCNKEDLDSETIKRLLVSTKLWAMMAMMMIAMIIISVTGHYYDNDNYSGSCCGADEPSSWLRCKTSVRSRAWRVPTLSVWRRNIL